MTNATSTPEPGQILAGKYLVEEVLGVGGMGVVVAAKHLQLDQRVAIKYLLPAALQNPEVVARFAREARAAAKIRGEHVARVIDVGQFDDGAPFMIMEYLEGHDLAKHLVLHGPLPIEDAMRWMLETCEALAEAHAAKIVHRDLKPSNLFLARQPDASTIIKVLDFGISKTGDAEGVALTKTTGLMGTVFYMSPEQLTSPKSVDHRSDIWTLGVILYELLAGRPPFPGESVPEIVGGILQNEPESVRALRLDVPLELERVIVTCMQSKAAARYPSVAALAAALGPFARPADRSSIDVTARVLGESLKPAAVVDVVAATLLMSPSAPAPPQAANAAGVGGGEGAGAAAQSAEADSRNSPAAYAQTAHGLSASAITTKPKTTSRATTWIAAGAVLAVVAAIGVVGVKLAGHKSGGPSSLSTGLTSSPSSIETAPEASTAVATASATASVSATAAPATDAPAASVVTPSAVDSGAPAPSPAVVAVQPRGSRAGASPAPVKSATAAAGAAPPAATTATTAAGQVPAPSSSSSKNPLQMGIK